MAKIATPVKSGTTTLGDILGVPIPDVRISSTTVTISPNTAVALLEQAVDRFQRESQQATVDRYADTMRMGYWHVSTIRMAVVQGQEGYYIVNGKHRLNATVRQDKDIEFQVECVVCDTEAEVRDLVAIEDRGKARTSVDIAQITGLTEELGIGRDYGKLAASVGQLMHGWTTTGGGVRQQVAHEVWAAATTDWLPVFQQYQEAVKAPAGGDAVDSVVQDIAKRLQSPAMIAMGMVLLRSQPDKARDFLGKVGRAYLPGNPTDPVRRFVNHVSSKTWSRNPAVQVRTAASVWNAYVRNEAMPHNLKAVESFEGTPANRVPVFIVGTPFINAEHSYYTPWPGQPVFYREGVEISPASEWSTDINTPQPRWSVLYAKADERKAKADAKAAKQEARVRKLETAAVMKQLTDRGTQIPDVLIKQAEELGLKIPKVKKPKKPTKADQPVLPEGGAEGAAAAPKKPRAPRQRTVKSGE